VKLNFLVGFALLLAVAGCRTSSTAKGDAIASFQDLKPDATIPEKASLAIGKIVMPVDITQKFDGGDMKIELEAHGQVLETEIYEIGPESFSLIEAAGERYDEPLPLLKFPFSVGETWKWVGKMTAGQEPHKASASISTSQEAIMLPSGSTDTVLVVVDLSIESGGPSPANRKMRFWFAKDKGVVKRQFGDASSREPAR
jgi:hypothetical protein